MNTPTRTPWSWQRVLFWAVVAIVALTLLVFLLSADW
jgi:hypothetical protein